MEPPPAALAFCGARAGEPVPTGARFRDTAQLCAVGWHCPEALVDLALARAESAEGDTLSVVLLRNRGDGHRRLMDLHAAGERARLWYG
jgi:hypothetical protein